MRETDHAVWINTITEPDGDYFVTGERMRLNVSLPNHKKATQRTDSGNIFFLSKT